MSVSNSPRLGLFLNVSTPLRSVLTGAGGASSSGAGPSLSDEFFQKIVEACMEKWSTDSTLFLSGAPSRQRISELAQEVVHGSIDPGSRDELLGLLCCSSMHSDICKPLSSSYKTGS